MKSVTINGKIRDELGKRTSRQARREGFIPCVLYGGKDVVHFMADEREFSKILYTPNVYIVKLNLGGKEYDSIIQETQFHPVSDKPTHLDFFEVSHDKKITIGIPVHCVGNSIGVRNGGNLRQNLRKLLVRAFIKDLPDDIEINIEELAIGSSVKVKDVESDVFEFIHKPGDVIVGVKTARAVIEEEVEEEAEAEEGAETPAEEAAATEAAPAE